MNRQLQSNSENREHLKYVWNVYCVITNHEQDLQPQKPQKTTEFPSVTEQICFVPKGLKINPTYWLYKN